MEESSIETQKTMEVNMKKKFFDYKLQLLADDPDGGEPDGGGEPKTYTQEEVNALIEKNNKERDEAFDKKFNKKFAEMQTAHEKKLKEAEERAKMSAEERAEAERKEMAEELAGYKAKEAKAKLHAAAKKQLTELEVNAPDDLIALCIAENEEATIKAAKSFAEMFKHEVSKAVADALKGNPPKNGSAGGSAVTKEDIMAIKNTAERQKMIAENMHLFK